MLRHLTGYDCFFFSLAVPAVESVAVWELVSEGVAVVLRRLALLGIGMSWRSAIGRIPKGLRWTRLRSAFE